MAEFRMPALGADMETGKVVEWLVRPGDHVKRGDVVAVVETHKGAIDVECFLDGLIENLAPLDVDMPVGAVLATVNAAGGVETAASAPAPAPPAPAPVAPPAAAPVPAVRTPAGGEPPATASRARVSPAARRRATELKVDADALAGSGADGAIVVVDVERAAATGTPPPRATRGGFDPTLMRQAIAAAMARSKREIPHYHLAETLPMRRALDWLRAANEARPVTERLLPAVLLIKAVALALREFPELNGCFVDGEYRPSAAVHVGVAISMRGGGLIAPALHDVAAKGLTQLMRELADLVKRCRAGGLRSSEIADPTVTVTNLGDQGVESVFGVIYPPQVALVGFGRIAERPWVEGGRVIALPVVTASLSADHRVSDGHRGARFLARLNETLQQPEEL